MIVYESTSINALINERVVSIVPESTSFIKLTLKVHSWLAVLIYLIFMPLYIFSRSEHSFSEFGYYQTSAVVSAVFNISFSLGHPNKYLVPSQQVWDLLPLTVFICIEG